MPVSCRAEAGSGVRRAATRPFAVPDCSSPRAVAGYARHRLDIIIGACQTLLDKVRGRDDVSFALVAGLLAAETHRRADVIAALAGPGARP